MSTPNALAHVDHQRLATLAATLRERPAIKLDSSPTLPRRASVAIILRLHAPADPGITQHQLEVLFIERAISTRDRWSGQIAFPGGRREGQETDRQAAERETLEEIGLHLDQPRFLYLGALDDRGVYGIWGWHRAMVLSPHVYLQLSARTPPLNLQPAEVASVHWIPLATLLRGVPVPDRAASEAPLAWHPVNVPVSSRVPGLVHCRRRPWLAWILDVLTGHFTFPCLSLPPVHPPTLPGGPMDASLFRTAGYPAVPHPFATPNDGLRLWGLTLFMTSDLVDTMWTRQPPRPLRGPLPVLDWWDVRLALRLWQRWTDRPVAGQVQSRSGPTAAYFLILRLAVAAAVLGRVTLGGLLISLYLFRGSRVA